MGIFNFLKKKEPLSKPQSEELPPIPPVRGPETPQESPQLRASLPPLPSYFSMPRIEPPSFPSLEQELPGPDELPEMPARTGSEGSDEIPSTIPPLEIRGREFSPSEQREMLHEIRGPVFVRTDKFKAFLDDIEQIRTRFQEEENIFLRINDVKNSEDKAFEGFREIIEDIQRKLVFIDKTLFEQARW